MPKHGSRGSLHWQQIGRWTRRIGPVGAGAREFFKNSDLFVRKPHWEACLVWLSFPAIGGKICRTSIPVSLHAFPGSSVRAEPFPVQQMSNGLFAGEAIWSCLSDFSGGTNEWASTVGVSLVLKRG